MGFLEEMESAERAEKLLRDGAFRIGGRLMDRMVEQGIYINDIEDATLKPVYLGVLKEGKLPVLAFAGRGTLGRPLAIFCRLHAHRAELVGVMDLPRIPAAGVPRRRAE